MENIQTRLAVVTGASSGIGFELAKQFAQHGFNLLICAEDAKIAECALELKSFGNQVDYVQADLSTYAGNEDLYSRIKGLNITVDAIAINAGVGVGGEFARTDLDRELRLIDLNIKSAVHLTKRV